LLAILLLLLGGAAACGGDPPSATPTPKPDAVSVSKDGTGAWRYLGTLEEAIPEGVVVEPLLEVANPDQARLIIVAAVHRPAADPALRVEQWEFSQFNDSGVLKSSADPVVVLATADNQPHDAAALTVLRQLLAAPRAQPNRPVGLPAPDPAALITQLKSLALIVRDDGAKPRARVKALAMLFRGLDDGVVIERRGLSAAIDALASGGWDVQNTRVLSKRRTAIDIGGEPPRELEIMKKSGGWAITAERPKK